MRYVRKVVLISSFIAILFSQVTGGEESGWRISPERINIQVGDDRPLQLLDDLAQELHGAEWSVSDPSLAEVREENGRLVVHAKATGTVRVGAAMGLEKRSRDIKIWAAAGPIPEGTTTWGTHSIGRDVGDLPAVPTADGPGLYSLEQTASGSTYLRAFTNDGVQVWSWLMPEQNHDVDLVCGDWMGGALISANHKNSYTLYTVGKDGQLRWKRTLAGTRKGIAYNLEHLIHVLSRSTDHTLSEITGLDQETGALKFELTIPASVEKRINIRKAGTKILCASESSSSRVDAGTSQLIVSSDSLAYVAFTQQEWELKTEKCIPGSVIDPSLVTQVRNQRVLLWQIHPDGTYRSTVVEESRSNGPLSQPLKVGQPTGALIPDGLGGVLLSVGWSLIPGQTNEGRPPEEFVYRLDENGKVVFQFPLPAYNGRLHDDMLLGQDDRVFATRGSLLIAFNLRDGRELWRWDSHTPDIQVFAALEDGSCLIQTPSALVKVENASDSQEVFQGKAMAGWQGQLYRKQN